MEVLMLGPDVCVRGGVSSVEKIILTAMKINISFLPTHRDVSKIKKLLFAFISLWKACAIFFRNKNIQLVYIHMSHGASFFRKSLFILLIKIFFKKKIILHMHGSNFDSFYNRNNVLIRRYIRFICNCAAKVIVLSKKWEQFYRSFIDKGKIEVIYNSVIVPDNNLYNPYSKKIVFLGILGQRKGIYDLIKIIPDVIKIDPNIKFVLAGDGEIDAVKCIVKKNFIEENVVIPGWVNERQKNEMLGQAVLYILPSYNEGLPMSVLEAMSFGVPVISTVVGGLPEVIENEVDGILIKPGDTDSLRDYIIKLISDINLRLIISNNSYKKIKEQYNSQLFVTRIENLIHRVI